ncbi:hypothetical protein [Streptomyces mexicanus]|uniref:hypothetical protein n=1 Tax=Streptomyces mexicanus TaxID=178566 RepID=UPI0036BE8F16
MHLIRVPRVRRFTGTAVLLVAGALALAGCGDGDGDSAAPKAAHSAPASAATASQQPEEAASTEPASPTPTPTPTPAATLRDYTGARIGTAIAAAKAGGVGYAVQLEGTGRRASSWSPDEKVCDQRTDTDGVTFTLARDGRDCAGRLLHTPAPTHAGSTGSGSTGSGGSGGTGGSGSGGGGSTACAITSPAGNCYADGQFCAQRHHGMSTYGKGGEYLTCEQDAAGRWRWSDGAAG